MLSLKNKNYQVSRSLLLPFRDLLYVHYLDFVCVDSVFSFLYKKVKYFDVWESFRNCIISKTFFRNFVFFSKNIQFSKSHSYRKLIKFRNLIFRKPTKFRKTLIFVKISSFRKPAKFRKPWFSKTWQVSQSWFRNHSWASFRNHWNSIVSQSLLIKVSQSEVVLSFSILG